MSAFVQFFVALIGWVADFWRSTWGVVTFHSVVGAIVAPIIVVCIVTVSVVIAMRRTEGNESNG